MKKRKEEDNQRRHFSLPEPEFIKPIVESEEQLGAR